jgi:hypothetical protein
MDESRSTEEEDKYLLWKSERQQRFRVVLSVVPAIIGLVAILYSSLSIVNTEFDFVVNRLMSILGPASLLMSGGAVLMIYLQTGFKKKPDEEINYIKYENEISKLRNRIEHSATLSTFDLEGIQEQLKTLREHTDQISSINEAITEEHKEEIVLLLKSEILKTSSDEVFKETLEKINQKVSNSNQLKEVESVFLRTLDRLYAEISALSRRGNLNLSLGILTTIIGLGILGYFVLEIDSIPEDKMAFIAHFIPRLSLVILIEVFAYFFLKLYKSSLSEIKYFQNEMTNAEAKLVAIKCSIMTSDETSTSLVIQALSNTERNAILEKGQTTAEIEKSRIEQQNISTISEKVSNIIGTKKSA